MGNRKHFLHWQDQALCPIPTIYLIQIGDHKHLTALLAFLEHFVPFEHTFAYFPSFPSYVFWPRQVNNPVTSHLACLHSIQGTCHPMECGHLVVPWLPSHRTAPSFFEEVKKGLQKIDSQFGLFFWICCKKLKNRTTHHLLPCLKRPSSFGLAFGFLGAVSSRYLEGCSMDFHHAPGATWCALCTCSWGCSKWQPRLLKLH